MNPSSRPRRSFAGNSKVAQKYRRGAGIPVHPLLVLALLVVGFGIVFAFGIYWITSRSVRLVIDGAPREVRTHQSTVTGLLTELSIYTESPDIVSPAGNTPIVNGLLITIDKAHPVVIEADGQRQRVLTHLLQPREILAEAGVVLQPSDVIYSDGLALRDQTLTRPPETIQVLRAVAVSLRDGDQVTQLFTAAHTVGEALSESKVSLYLADRISPPPDTPLIAGSTIVIQRSIPITIRVDGRVLTTRTGAKTVGGALVESGIVPFGLDYAIPDNETPISATLTIQVIRVTEEEEIEQTSVAYKQVTQTDSSIPPETQKVIQVGQAGIIERRVRVRREDGVVVSRSAPQEVLIRPPRDEIMLIGATPSLIQPETPVPTQSGS